MPNILCTRFLGTDNDSERFLYVALEENLVQLGTYVQLVVGWPEVAAGGHHSNSLLHLLRFSTCILQSQILPSAS